MVNFSDIIGKTFYRIDVLYDDIIIFYATDGSEYSMYHNQSCCESVHLESIDGDLNDYIIGEEIILADESNNYDNPLNNGAESFTWTFYKIGTKKGSVTLRWYGESNGYYSEAVYLYKNK